MGWESPLGWEALTQAEANQDVRVREVRDVLERLWRILAVQECGGRWATGARTYPDDLVEQVRAALGEGER